MAWNANERGNFAWLTKEASKYDDVDSFIDNIHNGGVQEGIGRGRVEGAVVTAGLSLVLFGVSKLVKSGIQKYKAKKKSVKETADASKEVIRQMCDDSEINTGNEEAENKDEEVSS